MQIEIKQQGGARVAVVRDGSVTDVQSALDLMADVRYQGCDAVALPKEAVCEAFFDLRTGLAGEILQKYSNYRMRIAIFGDFSGYGGRALRDFIRESNRVGQTLFLATEQEALDRLLK